MEQGKIRNFCIIAHIDHGKSTLADRFLELTKTIDKRKMKEQVLDQMDLERERGITIKMQPVTMDHKGYTLNLIDTPGHVDFTYEVSRSLAAVEGALLVVDASQGIQAQTLSNLYLAIEQGLEIIPVINKIDLPASMPDEVAEEITDVLGCKKEEIIKVSAKTGENVESILDAVIKKVPAPYGKPEKPFRALVFDSQYDTYKGVIVYVRVVDGKIAKNDLIRFLATKKETQNLETGIFKPEFSRTDELSCGQIGYIVTGFKKLGDVNVGDTVAEAKLKEEAELLPGYKPLQPMVYAGIFPQEGDDYPELKDAIEKLHLSDSSLVYDPESSQALGFGFRCGFLGLLHLEIVKERLSREYGLDLVITTPSVPYEITKHGAKSFEKDETIIIHSPYEMPDPSIIEKILEPQVKVDIFTPDKYIGPIMELCRKKRGVYKNTEYLSHAKNLSQAILTFEMPLSELIIDFYDSLKSVTSGFASLAYEVLDYKPADLEKLDILVAGDKIDAFSQIVHKDKAYAQGKEIVGRLKEIIPQQLFEVPVQAVIGGKVIARETIRALRKDVTAKLYGGDVTRKRKLLEKQKKGKKKMRSLGRVEIPTDAFIKVLKR